MKKLVILSHTEHYTRSEQYVGWGPTIREINDLTESFDEIVHIACLHKGVAPESCMPYVNKRVRFVPIPPFGGESLRQKLTVLRVFPTILRHLRKERKDADWTQVRLPAGFGVLLLPCLWLFGRRKNIWVKYAGNWKQPNAPIGYRIQRWWLRSNLLKIPVTINGHWPGQKAHLISFENPCLNEQQIIDGNQAIKTKSFTPPFHFTFIGKLFESKGLIKMIEGIAELDQQFIGKINIIGEGEDRALAEEFCTEKGLPAVFHGFLPVKDVHRILKDTHFVVLPSRSEGFPKVLAEGAAYGAIPIASAVSAIPHYFRDDESGFLWWIDNESFTDRLKRIPFNDQNALNNISFASNDVAGKFTFLAYRNSLKNKIFIT